MDREMSELYSALVAVAARYLKKRFVLTSTNRDCRKQLELSGPTSYHLNGHAFDAQLVPYNRQQQAWLGQLAETQGFRWGGRFRGNYDDVHFDNGNRFAPGRCPS